MGEISPRIGAILPEIGADGGTTSFSAADRAHCAVLVAAVAAATVTAPAGTGAGWHFPFLLTRKNGIPPKGGINASKEGWLSKWKTLELTKALFHV